MRMQCQQLSNKSISFVIGIFFLCVYIFFLNNHMTHLYDSSIFYWDILENIQKYPDTLFYKPNGNHIIFRFLVRFWYEFLRPILPISFTNYQVMSLINSVHGAFTISLLYLIMTETLNFDRFYAICASFSIGFSFYYLTYSTALEVYVIAFFYAFLALYLAFNYDKEKIITSKNQFLMLILIGSVHGIAMISHQQTVLFGLVILWHLRKMQAKWWIYILSGSVIVVSTYGFAFYQLSIDNFQDGYTLFLGSFAKDYAIEGNKHIPSYLAPYGLFTALLGGRYLLSLDYIKTLLQTHFSAHKFDRLVYLHHQTSDFLGNIQIGAYILFAIGLILLCCHWWQYKKFNGYIQYFWILFISCSAFFTFWFPHNPDFWGIQVISLIIIMMASKPPKKIVIILTFCIITINILGTAWPLKDPNNDLYGPIYTLAMGEK